VILVAVNQHLDAALDAAVFLDVLVQLLYEIRTRVAQYFRVIRVAGQTLRAYSLFRYEPNEPRVLPMTVADEQQRNRSRGVEIRQKTAHRIRVEGHFPWVDRMIHTVTSRQLQKTARRKCTERF
jgi:hypothetical protein